MDFNDYLIPHEQYVLLSSNNELGLTVNTDAELFLQKRVDELSERLEKVIVINFTQSLPLYASFTLSVESLDSVITSTTTTLEYENIIFEV